MFSYAHEEIGRGSEQTFFQRKHADPKEMKTLTQRKTNKHLHAHCRIIYNSQDLEAT